MEPSLLPTLIMNLVLITICYSVSTPFAETMLLYCNLNWHIWDMGTPTPEGFLCIMMLLGHEYFSVVCDSILSGLSPATPDHAYTLADIIAYLDYEQQAHSMALAQTVPIPAEAHIAQGLSTSDPKQSVCLNCKKSCHTAKFCVQPGGGMAVKSISEAQQVHDAKHSKKPKKPKNTIKGLAGSIIQAGNQAYIVDTHGKAPEIVSFAPSTTSALSTFNDSSYDDLDYIHPLVLDSMWPQMLMIMHI